MIYDHRKYSALIVSKSEKTAKAMEPILACSQFSKVCYAECAGKARRLVVQSDIDIVIINTPLLDDYGAQLAIDLAEKNIGVIIFVKGDTVDQITYKVEPYGVVVLPKPVQRAGLIQSIKILKAMEMKIEKLEKRNLSLEAKMREIKLVNRAKLVLITRMKMTEEEAHRYIEKTAMDQCVKKIEIAESIIKMYEV